MMALPISSDAAERYRCVPGRLVRLQFRERAGAHKVRESTVVYPWRWTRGNVLASARRAHPNMTVKVVEWHPFSEDRSFEPTVWIVDPQKIIDYGPTGGIRRVTMPSREDDSHEERDRVRHRRHRVPTRARPTGMEGTVPNEA